MAVVKVSQLQSRGRNRNYLNVNEDDGRITIYAHLYQCPVYVCWEGSHFYLHSFDSQEYADEFFDLHPDIYDKIERIEPYEEEDPA